MISLKDIVPSAHVSVRQLTDAFRLWLCLRMSMQACESRVSRRASLSTAARQHASSIVMAGDSPCVQGSAARELPGPVSAPEPTPAPMPMPRRRLRARASTPPSVRRQNRDRSPNVRPPPGGASSVTLG